VKVNLKILLFQGDVQYLSSEETADS